MTEEEKKKTQLLGDLYEKLNKAQQSAQHQVVLDQTEKILALDDKEHQAREARLTAMIKLKNFDQALELIKGNEKQYLFEKAYILHRQGKNQEALQSIQKITNKDDAKVRHLLSQVQYKLNDYKSTINNYQDLIRNASEDEVADIVTNLLACASNDVDQYPVIEKFLNSSGHEKTYEFYFNLSQTQMKQQLYQDAFKSLLKSYTLAKEDGSEQSDLTRFKVQEIHTLSNFFFDFNQIEYSAKSTFNLPKTLKHENLIEINMNAFQETYDLDKNYFKELIGNLNWNKFSERIAQQLTTNQNLTAEQKRLMQVNLIVALIRSHKFEQARKEWEKISSTNNHASLKGIGAYFFLKDKKYDEALALINKQTDVYSIFLRAQIYFAKRDTKSAFETLVQNLNESLLDHEDYLIFLIKQCSNYKVTNLSTLLDKLMKTKSPKTHKDLFLLLADQISDDKNKQIEILKQLYENHPSDKVVQSRYLNSLVDLNLQDAVKIQQKLPAPLKQDLLDNDDYLTQLIEDGMPEKKKEKKTKDVVTETKGGAEIFIPKKRKKHVRYPKGFDPKNPGQEPDPERWLPKWQRSRFKKYAKKKGIYLKGAQGDAQIDTDVTGGIMQSTAAQEVVQEKQKRRGRKK